MELLLNDVLHLSQEEISNSKIEFNMNEGSGGQAYIDKWLKHSESDKANGLCLDCSYWGWYGNKRNFLPRQWVFSFLRMGDDKWLFISAAEIVDVPENDRACVEIQKKFSPLFGRLVIKCKKGNTFSRYVFNLSKYIEQAVVCEILPCIYSGEQFDGYDKVHLPFHRLDDIFAGRILPTYYEALQKVSGVYCLTDKSNGKLYIGSATGEGGVAQRWGNYIDSKHGGNKKLIELYEKKGKKHFEENFTYTILEYYSLSYDKEKILERESYWKKCFDTINNGYNDN